MSHIRDRRPFSYRAPSSLARPCVITCIMTCIWCNCNYAGEWNTTVHRDDANRRCELPFMSGLDFIACHKTHIHIYKFNKCTRNLYQISNGMVICTTAAHRMLLYLFTYYAHCSNVAWARLECWMIEICLLSASTNLSFSCSVQQTKV